MHASRVKSDFNEVCDSRFARARQPCKPDNRWALMLYLRPRMLAKGYILVMNIGRALQAKSD